MNVFECYLLSLSQINNEPFWFDCGERKEKKKKEICYTSECTRNSIKERMCRVVVVIVVGNELSKTCSNPNEAVYISHTTNTFGKGMNPIILFPAMCWTDWVL